VDSLHLLKVTIFAVALCESILPEGWEDRDVADEPRSRFIGPAPETVSAVPDVFIEVGCCVFSVSGIEDVKAVNGGCLT
jgi:hypothetical protein